MSGSYTLTTPAAGPLFEVDDAKAFLNVVGTSDWDDLIEDLIDAATETVQDRTNRLLLPQQWELALDCFPCRNLMNNPYGEIKLEKFPVQAVTKILYTDPDGVERTLDPSAYILDNRPTYARIVPAYNTTWPNTRTFINSVIVQFTAGDEPPKSLKHAVRMLIASWFKHREALLAGQQAESLPRPVSFEALISQHKMRRA